MRPRLVRQVLDGPRARFSQDEDGVVSTDRGDVPFVSTGPTRPVFDPRVGRLELKRAARIHFQRDATDCNGVVLLWVLDCPTCEAGEVEVLVAAGGVGDLSRTHCVSVEEADGASVR
jgi:hypothetical protein